MVKFRYERKFVKECMPFDLKFLGFAEVLDEFQSKIYSSIQLLKNSLVF